MCDGQKTVVCYVCCIRCVTVDAGSSNDFVGCVVFIYIFWHLITASLPALGI